MTTNPIHITEFRRGTTRLRERYTRQTWLGDNAPKNRDRNPHDANTPQRQPAPPAHPFRIKHNVKQHSGGSRPSRVSRRSEGKRLIRPAHQGCQTLYYKNLSALGLRSISAPIQHRMTLGCERAKSTTYGSHSGTKQSKVSPKMKRNSSVRIMCNNCQIYLIFVSK